MQKTDRKKDEEVLAEIYRNAQLALQSISNILPQVEDKGARAELLSQHEEYEKLSQQLKELEIAKRTAANQLKYYLKEAEIGTVGERKITWKQIYKNSFDQKRLQEEKPDIFEDYLIQSSYRRLCVA